MVDTTGEHAIGGREPTRQHAGDGDRARAGGWIFLNSQPRREHAHIKLLALAGEKIELRRPCFAEVFAPCRAVEYGSVHRCSVGEPHETEAHATVGEP